MRAEQGIFASQERRPAAAAAPVNPPVAEEQRRQLLQLFCKCIFVSNLEQKKGGPTQHQQRADASSLGVWWKGFSLRIIGSTGEPSDGSPVTAARGSRAADGNTLEFKTEMEH